MSMLAHEMQGTINDGIRYEKYTSQQWPSQIMRKRNVVESRPDNIVRVAVQCVIGFLRMR